MLRVGIVRNGKKYHILNHHGGYWNQDEDRSKSGAIRQTGDDHRHSERSGPGFVSKYKLTEAHETTKNDLDMKRP